MPSCPDKDEPLMELELVVLAEGETEQDCEDRQRLLESCLRERDLDAFLNRHLVGRT